ncbi:MAG: hypothetical protein J6Q07_05670 [Alistipes sp.]|nr:hypothetical protein [Alistipes sp.]
MKILKLFAVIVVVAGAIYGLIQLPDREEETGPVIHVDHYTYDAIQQQIDGLKSAQTWDNAKFDKILSNIENSKKSLTDTEYRTLMHDLDNTALRRLDAMLMTEYAKQNCSANVINSLYSSVQHITTTMGRDIAKTLDDDKIIDRHANIYTIYYFVLSSYDATANFIFANSTWNNFESHANSVRNEARNYRGRPIFSDFLSDKPVFINGLDDRTINSKLNKARAKHDNNVFAAIKAAYNAQPFTIVNRDKLNTVFEKFQREFPSSDVNNSFVTYFMEYCEKVEEQQNNDNSEF